MCTVPEWYNHAWRTYEVPVNENLIHELMARRSQEVIPVYCSTHVGNAMAHLHPKGAEGGVIH